MNDLLLIKLVGALEQWLICYAMRIRPGIQSCVIKLLPSYAAVGATCWLYELPA